MDQELIALSKYACTPKIVRLGMGVSANKVVYPALNPMKVEVELEPFPSCVVNTEPVVWSNIPFDETYEYVIIYDTDEYRFAHVRLDSPVTLKKGDSFQIPAYCINFLRFPI